MGLFNFLYKQTGKKGSFRRNTLIMSSGAIVNILISFTLYPIITRLYNKEDFGNYGLIISVITILSLAGTALYPAGIVIPKFKKDYLALLKLCFYL